MAAVTYGNYNELVLQYSSTICWRLIVNCQDLVNVVLVINISLTNITLYMLVNVSLLKAKRIHGKKKVLRRTTWPIIKSISIAKGF